MNYFDITPDGLLQPVAGPGPVMVSSAPEEPDRTLLKARFRLDDYDLGSTLDADEVPRLESLDGRLLLIWKVPESAATADPVQLGVSTLGICLDRGGIAFIHAGPDVRFTEREFRGLRGVHDVMLALLLSTVRHFVGHLKVIRQISGELERKITVSMENRHLLQMFALSESIVYYQDAIEGNAAALARLRTVAGQFGFDARQLDLLDDIVLENGQAARQASIFASVHSGLMDARGTVVNNNMNVLLKNLTLINIIFLPLNLLASIGGMSEWTMMTADMDWRVSYILFTLGMVLVGWGTWLLMKTVIDRGVIRSSRGEGARKRTDRGPVAGTGPAA